MKTDTIIDVRGEVTRLRRRWRVVCGIGIALGAMMLLAPVMFRQYTEIPRSHYGGIELIMLLGRPDASGCRAIESIEYWLVSERSSHTPDHVSVTIRAGHQPIQRQIPIVGMTVMVGVSSHVDVVINDVEDGGLQGSSGPCLDRVARAAIAALGEDEVGPARSWTGLVPHRAGGQFFGRYQADVLQWQRALMDLHMRTGVFVILLVPFVVGCWVTGRRITRWKQLAAGMTHCPNCRHELAPDAPGVLLCSECGLRCRVGEG